MEDTSTHQYAYLQKDLGRWAMYSILIGMMYALLAWENHPRPALEPAVTHGILGALYACLCWRKPVFALGLTTTVLLTGFNYRYTEGAWSHEITLGLWWLLVPLLVPLMLFVLNPLYNQYLSSWGERESPPYRPHEEK